MRLCSVFMADTGSSSHYNTNPHGNSCFVGAIRRASNLAAEDGGSSEPPVPSRGRSVPQALAVIQGRVWPGLARPGHTLLRETRRRVLNLAFGQRVQRLLLRCDIAPAGPRFKAEP